MRMVSMVKVHTSARDERWGSVAIEPTSDIEAGSFASVTIVYTAGLFGIDDTGALRLSMRYATDMAAPQFSDAKAPNYVSVEASNGASLEVRYEPKGQRRPYDKSVLIRILRGYLKQGDRIVVRLGDRRFGSPGIRFQTAAEAKFQFRIAIDAMASGVYSDIEGVPALRVVAGPPARSVAVLPTLARAASRAKLGFRMEDRWGNPCLLEDRRLRLAWEGLALPQTAALPDELPTSSIRKSAVLRFCAPRQAGQYRVKVCEADGTVLAASNWMLVVADTRPLAFWGDLHGQSEETMGLNPADAYFEFARDISFLDVVGHQGIDFQMSNEFYAWLNRLTAAYYVEGQFVTLPGYEWAGNTGLGGDRNVYFSQETPAIYRSSHAVVSDLSDAASDANTAADLFKRLRERHADDAIVCAHVGGRYADIKLAHDGVIEKSVEIHSTWGTFEWLLHDAFDAGYRVGVVCNSDDHKGRQGAAHPGASNFGAYGGLTCIRAGQLTRPAIYAAMRRRRHYGTTGARIHLDVEATFDADVNVFSDDPSLGPCEATLACTASMGAIVQADARDVEVNVSVIGTAPIERIEIRSGKSTIETFRPHAVDPASRRIRIMWEGAEYRGRGRETTWDGRVEIVDNTVSAATPVNFFNPEKTVVAGRHVVSWQSLTSGNAAGVDLVLQEHRSGRLVFESVPAQFAIAIADIGADLRVFAVGGLSRKVSIHRLPERLDQHTVTLQRRVALTPNKDTPIWVCVVQEDGHRAWSSPIYVIP
jgi:hypothetical protein